MKKQYGLGRVELIIIIVLIVLFAWWKGYPPFSSKPSENAEAKEENWKLYSDNEQISYYYDTKSVARLPNGTIKVSAKMIYTDAGRDWAVKKGGAGYRDLDHILGLMEIDCANKRFRNLSATTYSKKGKVINSTNSPKEWIDLPQSSAFWLLYEDLCK